MNTEKIQQLGHVVAGLIIMVHGFDSFESGDFKSAGSYLGVAILFILLAGWHKSVTQRFLQGDAAFFLLEAVIMFYSAWDYSTKGKTGLFYGMAVAGVIFVIFALISIKLSADMPKKRKSRRKKRRRSSYSGEDIFAEGMNRKDESVDVRSGDRDSEGSSDDGEERNSRHTSENPEIRRRRRSS